MSIFKKAETKTQTRGTVREISPSEAQAVGGGTANTPPGCGTGVRAPFQIAKQQ